ncbi:MAG: proline dehydrogenase family protein [Nanoarchaeota archaeon]
MLEDVWIDARRTVNKAVLDILLANEFGHTVFRKLAEPYLAGHSAKECLDNVCILFSQENTYSTCDILGEAATTPEKAKLYQGGYVFIAQAIKQDFITSPVTLSVKPTAIISVNETGYLADETTLFPTLEALVQIATPLRITLDMEDHRFTDISLKTAERIWQKGHAGFGIVLQTRLNRTEDDINHIITTHYAVPKKHMRVRICIGIYLEPSTIATTRKREAKDRLFYQALNLIDAGIYTEIATHDLTLLERLDRALGSVPAEQYEYQFLKGVGIVDEFRREKVSEGKTCRLYMPFELLPGDGEPYLRRRLIANPDLISHGAKNFLSGLFRRNGKTY